MEKRVFYRLISGMHASIRYGQHCSYMTTCCNSYAVK
jgi:hypothetical protein